MEEDHRCVSTSHPGRVARPRRGLSGSGKCSFLGACLGAGLNLRPAPYTPPSLLYPLDCDSVHAKGSLIVLQLWHMGRQSHSSYHGGQPTVSASAIAVGQGQTTGADGKKYDYEVGLRVVPAEGMT